MLVAVSKVAKTMPDMGDFAPAKPDSKRKSKKKGGNIMDVFNDPKTMEVLQNAAKMFTAMAPTPSDEF